MQVSGDSYDKEVEDILEELDLPVKSNLRWMHPPKPFSGPGRRGAPGRVNVTLGSSLKKEADEAASQAGLSTPKWIVQLVLKELLPS